MPRASQRPALVFTVDEKVYLDQICQSRTAPVREVQRAQILWRYHAGEKVAHISRALKMTRKSVLKWIDKALQVGVKIGIKDTPHKPREAVITDDAQGMGRAFGLFQAQRPGLCGGGLEPFATRQTCEKARWFSGIPFFVESGQSHGSPNSEGAIFAPGKDSILLGTPRS